MTDLSAPAPAAEAPANLLPAEDPGFEDNLKEFLGHSLEEPEVSIEASVAAPAEPSTALTSAVTSAATPAPAATSASAAPAAASVMASASAPAATEGDQVDPNLLVQMMGAGATTPAPVASAAVPAAAAESAPFAPIPNNFKLPAQMTAAIFESEDPATREQALSNLLASFGNALVQIMDQRVESHHAPRMTEAVQTQAVVQQQARVVFDDFYGNFPDLKEFSPVVLKAFEVIRANSPQGTNYSQEVRNKVGHLARQTLKQMGVAISTSAPAAAPSAQAVASTQANPGQLFLAGGARPTGISPADDSPGAMLDSMRW